MDRDAYEKDLAEKQKNHLNNVSRNSDEWTPCSHDECIECLGTGIKRNGSQCVHMISCRCPKCNKNYFRTLNKTTNNYDPTNCQS